MARNAAHSGPIAIRGVLLLPSIGIVFDFGRATAPRSVLGVDANVSAGSSPPYFGGRRGPSALTESCRCQWFAGCGYVSPISAVHTASDFRERARSSAREMLKLFPAHPAVINPDREKTETASAEIPGRSVEIIYSGFNNTKTQDVWILLAEE